MNQHRHLRCVLAALPKVGLYACGLALLGLSVLGLALLSACSTLKTEEERFEDHLAYELSREQVPGSSGADFSPDGRWVAVANHERVRLYDAISGELSGELPPRKTLRKLGGRNSLRFIDDGRALLGRAGAVLLWDVELGIVDYLVLPSRFESPPALAWSRATRTMAVASRNTLEPVTLAEITDEGFGEPRPLTGFTAVPIDLVFSEDGRYVAGARESPGVRIVEVESGKSIGLLPTAGAADHLERFGDRQLLVSGEAITLWNFIDGSEVGELHDPNLQWQIDGQVANRVVGVIGLGSLSVLTGVGTVVLGTLEALTGSSCHSCSDGLLAAGKLAKAAYEHGQKSIRQEPTKRCGRTTTISPDGRWLVDVHPGITREVIRVFDLEAETEFRRLNPRGAYTCVAAFSPDSQRLLLTTDRVVMVYDTQSWGGRRLRWD